LERHRSSKNLSILDARSRSAYRRSHIPGAIHADLFHYFVPGTDRKGLQKFQNDLATKLGNMGLTGKETMVVYESEFGMRAARVGWMLEYAGAGKVRLLEGGFGAWRKSHYRIENGIVEPEQKTFQVRPVSRLLATADELRSARSTLILTCGAGQSSRARKAETATNAEGESLMLDGLNGQDSSVMGRNSRHLPKWQMPSSRKD